MGDEYFDQCIFWRSLESTSLVHIKYSASGTMSNWTNIRKKIWKDIRIMTELSWISGLFVRMLRHVHSLWLCCADCMVKSESQSRIQVPLPHRFCRYRCFPISQIHRFLSHRILRTILCAFWICAYIYDLLTEWYVPVPKLVCQLLSCLCW